MRREDIPIAGLAIIVLLISAYIHAPNTPIPFSLFGLKYTDLVHGVFNPRFHSTDAWLDTSPLRSLASLEYACPLPYVHYKFEYPPLVGALWALSTCGGLKLAMSWGPPNYLELVKSAALAHYLIQVLYLSAFFILTILVLRRLGASRERVMLWIALPSTILYLIYNWDIIASSLALLGLYAFYKRRFFASGLLMGLSVSAKLLTIGLASWLALELYVRGLRKWGNRYLVGLALTAALPTIALFAVSPLGFAEYVSHHAGWYCENCLYMLLIRDIWSPLHRYLYASLLALMGLALLICRLRARDIRLSDYLVPALYAPVILNYVFSPQMALLLSPFSIYLLRRKALLAAYVVADTMNALIIVVFFEDERIRKLLGLPGGFNPWTLDSPVQWIAAIRNILLLAIMAYFMLSLLRKARTS